MPTLKKVPDAGKSPAPTRPQARGKFIFAAGQKIQVRGVTYGAFEPDADGNEYHDLELVDRDFAQMVENGINAVRIPHTTPPRALLDVAERHGLWVMVGLSVEQEIGYFVDGKAEEIRRIEETLRAKVRACRGHPALLCYALGNEIPASIARWLGRRKVEQILERMFLAVKREDPEGLVTYVNYPTTEYLQLPFLDLLCFNVYLESEDRLEAYLARLQNIAGDRPLLMSELGLDALRNGETMQAEVLDWQIRTSFESGCAGVFIFSWTDEWHRAGAQVEDWAFGLTDIARRPKPALAAVKAAFLDGPWARLTETPRVSVVVCSYNGSRTLRECCEHLRELDYPDFEVIVVDDGSSDGTADIARAFGFQVIRSEENAGLGSARNTGLAAASGEIVAYIDDDAFPDRDWLRYLAARFSAGEDAAVGGPNVTVPDDGEFARCVGYAPGNPAHVLITDTQAEQLPGCNLAIRRAELETIGGFDPQFRRAGDDVDVCWRLREHGLTLGFCPAAMVWHHRRGTLAAYLGQQAGYGEAESLLERKWSRDRTPRRGRVYGAARGFDRLRSRIYHGVWGHAPFQSIYEGSAPAWASLHLSPEFYLGLALLLGLSVLAFLWRPLWPAAPLLGLGVSALVLEALVNARRSASAAVAASGAPRWRWIAMSTLLNLLQPLARLWGRFRGLRGAFASGGRLRGLRLPRPITGWRWSENWVAPEKRIEAVEAELRTLGIPLVRGGDYDAWDLELQGGFLGGARLSIAVEDHSGAAQMIRYRLSPRTGTITFALIGLLVLLAVLAAADAAWLAAAVLGVAAAAIALRVIWSCARAASWGLHALGGIDS